MAETIDFIALAAKLKKIAQSDIGIYYVIRYPTRWMLFPLPEQAFGDRVHIESWRSIIVPELASVWATTLGVEEATLRASLLPLAHAFPRGRIERVAVNEYTIYHGNDLGTTGVSQDAVIQAFTLSTAKVNWAFDPHEQCEVAQKENIRKILNLTDDWMAK